MLKTSIKSLALLAALFGTGELMAQTCNTTAWGVGLGAGQAVQGSPAPGSPTDATAVSRYSGRCGLLSDTAAEFVRDGSPNDEGTYIARFYVRPAVTTGTAILFQALQDLQAVPSIEIGFNGTQFTIAARGAVSTTAPATSGRWYAVEVNWTAGGAMTYNIKGAGSVTAATGSLSGVTAGAQVDQANLGWISGGSGGTVNTDAFESRRTQPIGRLCRGDAFPSDSYNIQDRIALNNEILRLNGDATRNLSTGQPDVNEDGTASVQDRILLDGFLRAVPVPTCAQT